MTSIGLEVDVTTSMQCHSKHVLYKAEKELRNYIPNNSRWLSGYFDQSCLPFFILRKIQVKYYMEAFGTCATQQKLDNLMCISFRAILKLNPPDDSQVATHSKISARLPVKTT
jgi:hypothetical protein